MLPFLMNLPKVKFIDMPLVSETSLIHCFLLPDKWNWSKYITKKHPTLKKLFFKNKKDQLAFVKIYLQFRKIKRSNKEE